MGSNFGLCPEEPEKKKLPYLITCIEEKFTCIGAWENRWKIWQMTVKPLLQKITACLDRGTLKPNTDVGHEWFYGQVFTCQVFCPIIVCISPDPQMYSLRQKKKKRDKKRFFLFQSTLLFKSAPPTTSPDLLLSDDFGQRSSPSLSFNLFICKMGATTISQTLHIRCKVSGWWDWTMPHRYQNPPKQVWAPMSNFEVSAYRPIWLLTSWSIRGIFSAVTPHSLSFLTSESSLLTHSRKSHAESASWLDSEDSFVGGGERISSYPPDLFICTEAISWINIWATTGCAASSLHLEVSRLCHLPLERGLWNGDWRLGTERGSAHRVFFLL